MRQANIGTVSYHFASQETFRTEHGDVRTAGYVGRRRRTVALSRTCPLRRGFTVESWRANSEPCRAMLHAVLRHRFGSALRA
jgi:hypothetical protein